MVSKKTTEKKEETSNNFDLNKALTGLNMSDMFKAGLNYYIQSNELKIVSQKAFDKIVKEYSELQL